jgi:hypothetical protein
LIEYWHVFILFYCFQLFDLFIQKSNRKSILNKMDALFWFFSSWILLTVLLVIGGIRGGDFKKSTRPINLLDASRHVKT